MRNVDHIIFGSIWGSSSISFTVARLELSGCLTSAWHSMMRFVGVIKMGNLASIVVLFVGPVPGTAKFCLWTLFCISMEFHSSKGPMAKGEWGFPSCPARLSLLRTCDRTFCSPRVL